MIQNETDTDDTEHETCAETGCEKGVTHKGPAEGGATPNPSIVGWCDEHATAEDRKI